jgi:hypothetical protein
MSKGYYNTNEEQGATLKESEARAQQQESEILDFFREYRHSDFTPCEVAKAMPHMLLTSVRRAITNLTDQGFLLQTEVLRMGIYGKRVHTWKFKAKAGNAEQEFLPGMSVGECRDLDGRFNFLNPPHRKEKKRWE